MRFNKLLLVGVLLAGLSLTSCNESSTQQGTSKPSVYEVIDTKIPFTEKYSKEYDVEKHLKVTNDVCADHYGTATLVPGPNGTYNGDGDTANFSFKCNGVSLSSQAIRFKGLDAHELHHPSIGSEPWALAEAQYAGEKILGAKKIILQTAENGMETTYNRRVAFIWVDGILLDLSMVEIGLFNKVESYDNVHGTALSDAQAYRTSKNGYKSKGMDLAKFNPDPNWNYAYGICPAVYIESQPCVKDQNYKYTFREIGPANAPVTSAVSNS